MTGPRLQARKWASALFALLPCAAPVAAHAVVADGRPPVTWSPGSPTRRSQRWQ